MRHSQEECWFRTCRWCIIPPVPNQRSPEQELIAFALKVDLLQAMDEQREEEGKDRSRFIREAILEDLNRKGHNLPSHLALAPGRVKKDRTRGRAPTSIRYAQITPQEMMVAADSATGAPGASSQAAADSILSSEMEKVRPRTKRPRKG